METIAQTRSHQTSSEELFAGNGEMAVLMRAFDWSASPLGPVETWSPALRMIVRFLLANRFPQLLWWGPRYIQIYNDAYRPIPGEKHPAKALGQPASECWAEIWDVIGPLIDTPYHGGPATWMDDIFLVLNRYGYDEETHFTIAYSPVPDETVPGGVGGVLATVHEITEKVIGERRLALLRETASALTSVQTTEEVFAVVSQCIETNARDLPFTLLYLFEGEGSLARLVCSTGIPSGHPLAVPTVDSQQEDTPWPLPTLLTDQAIALVDSLPERFEELPCDPWDKPAQQAVVVPIAQQGQKRPAGFLVAALNPYRKADTDYNGFVALLAGQIASSLANARAYEEEKKRAEALAELDRAKTAFFNNVSHEFRTPLTLMLGPVEDVLAKSDEEVLPENRELLTVAHRNGMRLLKLVNTLLDFSRIEAGRVQARYAPTDLAAYTAELASVFRSAIEKAGMRLIVDCPPLSEPTYVDRDMWEKVVLNLLSNAFKFTLEGEIAVTMREQDGQAILSVRDTGTGIAPEHLPHIFERFHRVEGARARTHEGTGIGLALVLELVRLHDGTVGVESDFGQGTTFTVSLPLGFAHLSQDRISAPVTLSSTALRAETFVEEALRWLPEESQAVVSSPFLTAFPAAEISQTEGESRACIVLADDNADMREYVQRLLQPHYEVIAVANGEEALQAIQERLPDLIVSDVMMPVLDGFGLVRELRNNLETASIPILLLSARAGEEARIEGLSAGADDYLIKPFSAQELLARIRSQLAMARLRDEAAQTIRSLNAQLRADLESMTRMQQLSTRLIQTEDFALLLEEIVDAAIGITQADMGNIQLLENGALKIIAQRGFDSAFLDFFNAVQEGEAACGTAMLNSERVIVEDVASDPIFSSAPVREAVLASGARAVQSTPLVSRAGRVIGMFSTHYRTAPHHPTERELRLLDILARLAADLIEHRQSEAALSEREHRYRQLVSSLPTAVYTTDAEGHVLPYNAAAVELWGRTPEIGKDLWCGSWKIYTPDGLLLPLDSCPMARVLRDGRSVRDEEIVVERPDGTRRWVLPHPDPIFDASGAVVGAVNLLLDITERKRFELDQARLAAIVNSSEDAIVSKDLNGIVTSWNKAAERIYGWKAEEIIGKSKALVIPPELPDELSNILRRIRAGERIEHYETRRVRKDGRIIDVAISVSPINDLKGRIVGAATIVRDITERKRIERDLHQKHREVEDLNVRLRRSMTETHHRVKNNLQLVSALIDMQRNTDEEMVSVSEFARLASNVRALSLIHDIHYPCTFHAASRSIISFGPLPL